MTSVAGVSSSSSSQLLQMLQKLTLKRAETSSSTTSAQSTQCGACGQATFDSRFEGALVAAGLDESQVDEVKSAIKEAVSSALSATDQNTDPRAAVAQAVDETLQKYGVDTDKLKEELKPEMGSRPPGGGGDFDAKITEALTAAGVGSSKLDEIKNAIDEAIAEAQQKSDGKGDPEAVKSAVHEVLDAYGIDKDAFDQTMEAGMGSRPAGPPPESGGETSNSSLSLSLLDYLDTSEESTDSYEWLAGLLQILDEQA
ncbi:MAG: hypothetical protein GXY44_10030 [Phycisphaerales bacterium]|nr:hypothetical protein [Phycisphaerales bacterium]